jgi:muramoyltetrapeptide carboxypeptidase
LRIAIVAPSCALDPSIARRLVELRAANGCEFIFHPQCFDSEGHFAGSDESRKRAFVELANDPTIDAIWFARGGYGACRVALDILPELGEAARTKRYLGYSDAGFLLAGLYKHKIGTVAHGPMPSDLNREFGARAVERALNWFQLPVDRAVQPHVAFNLTVFSQLLGTPLQPDLAGHILCLEEVSEYMYRVDRSLFHVTSNAEVQKVAGIKLGRCSAIPDNDPDFVLTEEQICKDWCKRAAIPYLGRADIGHDVDNKIIAFG